MGPAFLPWVACLALVGCGRFGFDSIAGGGGDDATPGAVTLRYPIDTAYGVRNVTPVSLVPVVTGAPVFSAVTPLPDGVALDPQTGAIAGVPTATVRSSSVIRAMGANGSATAKVSFVYSSGYVVDVTADGEDDDGGTDTNCASAIAGGCSLRAAIQTANAHATELKVITLPVGVVSVVGELPSIGADIAIVGVDPRMTTIRSQPALAGFRALQLSAAHELALVRTGFSSFGLADGAVVAQSAGSLLVDQCRFENNQAAGSGGVFFIHSGAKANVRRSTFIKNESFGGCCGGWGGVVDGEDAATVISFSQCYATGNRSNWGSFAHITAGTQLRIENSTLYGNTATTAGTLASPGGTYTLVNDTIVGNKNTNGTSESAGLYLYSEPAHYTVQSSIVAFNTDVNGNENNCNRRVPGVSLTSLGGNLFSDPAGNCAGYFTQAGDRLSTDPALVPGAPVDNGGFTETILPKASSLAISAGTACPTVDQRDQPRDPMVCDAGAVELP